MSPALAGPVVVLGGGSTGEAFCAALRRLDSDVSITLVERELVGGECTYWACMPSKTLLRAPEVVHAARLAPGAAEALTGPLDAERIFWWRDQVVDEYNDSSHERWLAERRIELVRGEGRVVAPGRLEVAGQELEYGELVIATGSVPSIPPIPGLDGLEYWTSRQATSAREIPESLLVIGGGVVGCEIAQFYRRVGSRVTIVEVHPQLLGHEDPSAAELLQDVLQEEGVEIRLGAQVERVAAGFTVELAGGETLDGERLLVATGRRETSRGSGSSSSASRSRGEGSRSTTACARASTSGRSAT